MEQHLADRLRHINISHYIKDIVFAANDGAITTFALVAGVTGAHLSPTIILVIGSANLIADGFAMATGNYLGTKSEQELYEREERAERKEIQHVPHKEEEEIAEILAKKGYHGQDLKDMTRLITSKEQNWIDFMMHEELGLFAPDGHSPMRKAMATFLSFSIAGAIPLLPYLFSNGNNSFGLAVLGTAIALFTIGALRHYFSDRSWLVSGMEMLIIGGSAASIAYLIGYALRALTHTAI